MMSSFQAKAYVHNIDLNNVNDCSTLIYSRVVANTKVLDVGCSRGELGTLLHQRKSCEVSGLEYNADSVEICRQSGDFTKILQVDLDIFEPQGAFDEPFDYIIFADVLEHLRNPEQVLAKFKPLLKADGCFLLSIPNVAHASIKANLLLDDWTYTPLGILDNTHIRFFTYQSLAKFLSDLNLQITDAQYTRMPLNGYQPHKISELPISIQKFITQDVHSQICQYVVRCQKTSVKANDLYDHNLQILSFEGLHLLVPKIKLKDYFKRFLMLKCPTLLKYVQNLRK